MSYRKIEVDDQVFEYSVGRTHTKIRGVGAFKNVEVGTIETVTMYNSITDEFETDDVCVQVKPSNISWFIKRNKLKLR
jgi:hypothetical protein